MRWITATNLQQWAGTIPARANFPGLVGDLIRASASDISNMRFPQGDKGQVRGFDGILETTEKSTYVPEGKSVWEFGVTEGAASKAISDYNKRTSQVNAADRKEATFVFVSPHTWDNPQEKLSDWVSGLQSKKEWKDVKYIDGVMLEEWLSTCPAVAARWAKYDLGLMPKVGVRSTDEFWDEYSNRYTPALVEDVLLADRRSQADELLQAITSGADKLAYAADSPDEVIAFTIATIRRADPEVRRYLESRTLVLDTDEAARTFSVKSGYIFLPRSTARSIIGLLSKNGPTVISAGADEKRSNHKQLTRPTGTALGKAFLAMGYTEIEGYNLARKCGRSLAVLARQIPSGTAENPEWIDHAVPLMPAILAGAWESTSTGDKSVLCTLSDNTDYGSVEFPLRKLMKLKDPPIDLLGTLWAVRAPIDAFVHIGHLIGQNHLNQFRKAIEVVFANIPPPPEADQLFKPKSERDDVHSNWLREGIMNTLLHMAVLHEQAEFTVAGTTPQEFVNDIVRNIPGLSSDHRLLAGLNDNLALLAEAAPIPFLEALERLLEGDASAIQPIFVEKTGFLVPRSYHLGVLWGLETIAWDPALLSRTVTCLARLAKIDPGGKVSNRPMHSLRSIFLSWAPNTSANVQQRNAALKHVVTAVPEVAWPLLVDLLPKSQDINSPSAKPKFREFGGYKAEDITYSVVWNSQAFVIKLALEIVGEQSDRWRTLIFGMSQFQLDPFNDTLNQLRAVLSNTHGDAHFEIWDSLRKEANRHRAFDNADWAMNQQALASVDQIIDQFKPTDMQLQNTWLFDDWLPDIAGKYNADADPAALVEAERLKALQAIFSSSGLEGIVNFSKRVKFSQFVGASVRSLSLSKDQLLTLLDMTIQSGNSLNQFSGLVLAEGASRFGEAFTMRFKDLAVEYGIDPPRAAYMLSALDEDMHTWSFIQSFGAEVAAAYWTHKQALTISGDQIALTYAIDQYVSHGRPIAAIQASSRRLQDLSSETLLNLLDAAVPEINSTHDQLQTMTVYYIEKLFSELEKRSDILPIDIARRELIYLPCFSQKKKPLILHTMLLKQPKLFMEAICVVFKSDSGEQSAVSEIAARLAMSTYNLLEGLRSIPGQSGNDVDSSILAKWCDEVRSIATTLDRVDITDSRIGHLLAHAPASPTDHAWPHEAVRAVLENAASEKIEHGIVIERYNMRGVFMKSIGEGGNQERKLADQAEQWARKLTDTPRTQAMLFRIRDRWKNEADYADLRAEQDNLRG